MADLASHFLIGRWRISLLLLLLNDLAVGRKESWLLFVGLGYPLVGFLLFFVALVMDVVFILNVELATLQVDVVDVEVVLVQLHVDHLLSFLVHFIFFEALVDLVNFVSDFRLVFDGEKSLDLRLGGIQDLA